MIFSLCIFGGITLLLHSNRNRAKVILACSMLFWALLIGAQLAINCSSENSSVLFQPEILIIGGFVTASTTCYVIEVLRPRYLTLRRFIIFFFPFIVIAALTITYYCTGHKIQSYHNLTDLFAKFNIDHMLRVLLLLITIFYMILPAYLVLRYNRGFTRYLLENVSNPEDYDLNWLKRIMLILSAIYISYIIMLITNNKTFYIINKSVLLVLWYYFFYRALFLKEISLSHNFSKGWNAPFCQTETENVIANVPETNVSPKSDYIEKINYWFEHDKPYLRENLRLSDLQREFPISRTYLSRLLNKELGSSFSDYVNSFRVEESKRLLEETPEIEMQELAERSGFNSVSTFRRAFIKQTGMTLAEYKKKTTSLLVKSK